MVLGLCFSLQEGYGLWVVFLVQRNSAPGMHQAPFSLFLISTPVVGVDSTPLLACPRLQWLQTDGTGGGGGGCRPDPKVFQGTSNMPKTCPPLLTSSDLIPRIERWGPARWQGLCSHCHPLLGDPNKAGAM